MTFKNSNIEKFISFLNSLKNTFHKIKNVDEDEAKEIKRFLDEDEDRVYKGGEAPDGVYSVTTILDKNKDDQKKGGIHYWKQNNDGTGNNADWEDILHYKTNRGTLAHYAAFNRFDHRFQHSDTMWTEDEQSSQKAIDEKAGDHDYIYSVMKDKGFVETREEYRILRSNEDISLQDMLTQDINYVQQEFDKICRDKNIKASTVDEVEAMFARPENTEHGGFGGQADLLYTDPETGEHVVADLKTSKQVYDKHKHQIAAYAQAAKEDPSLNGDYIDRCEIIRINPDQKESEVFEVDNFESYWEEFAEMTRTAYTQ